MKRIVLVILKLFFPIIAWIFKIKSYVKKEDLVQEKYVFLQNIVEKINKKGKINVLYTGQENLPKEEGYLITPNHQGMYDPLLVVHTHKKPLRLVFKQELTKVFLVKDVLKMLKCLPMDRGDVRQSLKVINEMSKEIESGINFVIFPEGTRSKNKNELLEFKHGSFKAAMKVKAPIVPVAILNAYKVFDSKDIKPVDVEIHYLEPIYYEEYKDLKSAQVATLVEDKIKAKIKEREGIVA